LADPILFGSEYITEYRSDLALHLGKSKPPELLGENWRAGRVTDLTSLLKASIGLHVWGITGAAFYPFRLGPFPGYENRQI
jgi:hypothetical protein